MSSSWELEGRSTFWKLAFCTIILENCVRTCTTKLFRSSCVQKRKKIKCKCQVYFIVFLYTYFSWNDEKRNLWLFLRSKRGRRNFFHYENGNYGNFYFRCCQSFGLVVVIAYAMRSLFLLYFLIFRWQWKDHIYYFLKNTQVVHIKTLKRSKIKKRL